MVNSGYSSSLFINIGNENNKLNDQNNNDFSFETQIARALKKIAINYYNNMNNNCNKPHYSLIFNYYCSPFFIRQNDNFTSKNDEENYSTNFKNSDYVNNDY